MENNKKLRVAAYVRVSEETKETQHSLHAQEEFYRRQIHEKAEWELAGIYKDNGISGTDIKRREGFVRLISDCEAGKIDLILVKSVSRFARNTLDLLRIVRYLKRLGISVRFEEQNIDSMTEEGELMLTLMASVAQAESESISENIKWAIHKAFQNGIGNTRRRTLGYEWIDGKLTVIPEEAEVVKRIFANFLAGGSHMKTAEELIGEGITSINGKPISVSAIGNILRNITYTGNTLLQKTFIQDPISKKKVMNTGELPQYFVQDTHEAIIDMDTFEQVQKKLAQNKEMGRFPYNHTGRKYPFTMKVICGCCGRHYTRQLWNTSAIGKKRPTWVCTGKKAEKYRRCGSKNIPEAKLMEASAKVLGVSEFDEDIFFDKVESITVQGVHELLFCLHDGTEVIQHWEHTAQKASWTPERKARHAANRTASPAETKGASCMIGRIRCELCGMNYNKQTRKVARAGMVTFWKCRGIGNGGSCASEQITHDHLNSILAEALGVAQMTDEIFTGQIDHIGMCEPGKLIIYKKNDGTIPGSYELLPMEKRQKPYRPRNRKGNVRSQGDT